MALWELSISKIVCGLMLGRNLSVVHPEVSPPGAQLNHWCVSAPRR